MSQSVVWAFNPDDKNKKLLKGAAADAVAVAKQLKCRVDPVYVVELGALLSPRTRKQLDFDSYLSESKSRAQKTLLAVKSKFINRKNPVVIESGPALADQTSALAGYAARKKSPLIVSSTSGRGGLKRAVLGSFAESLVHRSSLPVLSVGPGAKPAKSFKTLLFATDFTPESQKAFKRFCEFARQNNAKVIVYSSVSPLLGAVGYDVMAGTGMLPSIDLAADAMERAQKSSAKLLEKARKQYKVKAVASLAMQSESTSHDILKAAKKLKVDMIGLAATGNPERVHLLGTIVQDVLRKAPVPVWTYQV